MVSMVLPNLVIKVIVCAACIAVPLLIGFVGVVLARPAINTWYECIKKAPWDPPNIVNIICITVMYVCMGVGSFYIWLQYKKRENRRQDVEISNRKFLAATISYVTNLVLNGIWSPLFFTAGWFLIACIDHGLLVLSIVACVFTFFRISKIAGALMVPYLLWESFGLTLSIYIVANNPNGTDCYHN